MPVAANAAVSSDDPENVLTSAIQPNNGEKLTLSYHREKYYSLYGLVCEAYIHRRATITPSVL